MKDLEIERLHLLIYYFQTGQIQVMVEIPVLPTRTVEFVLHSSASCLYKTGFSTLAAFKTKYRNILNLVAYFVCNVRFEMSTN